tara:strand:+ start:228 stop:461 length:234 start_codon:yes stop_codon:yes gene_type:complete
VWYALKRINQLETILVRIQEIISYSANQMKVIDAKGTFESDDEVGFFFKEIKNTQEILNGVFETDKTEENTDAKKKS